jgi:hypothetical protein
MSNGTKEILLKTNYKEFITTSYFKEICEIPMGRSKMLYNDR